MKINPSTHSALTELFRAFDRVVSLADDKAAVTDLYDLLRREVLGVFQCQECGHLCEAGEEGREREFLCIACEYDAMEMNAEDAEELEEYLRRAK